jgi:hypothetical protein
MLSIMEPVELENLVLFRDDEEPRKFYLLPDQPVIAVDDHGVPDFYFIKYVYDATSHSDDQRGGGYVQFRTVLTIAPDRLNRVITGLKAQLTQEQAAGRKPFGVTIAATDPILAAPLWTGGTVKLETFAVGDKELVRKATQTAPVDLAGSLAASVNLQLDPEGAEIFWTSFKNFADQQIPILISYELTYKARVSARMEIHAKRSTVEQAIWKRAIPRPYHFSAARARWIPMQFTGPATPDKLPALQMLTSERVAFMAEPSKVGDAIHSCVTDGTIDVKIDIDEADNKDSGSKVQDMLFKVATDLLSGQIIPALFGSATPQPAAASDRDTTVTKQLIELKTDTSDTAAISFDISLTSSSTIQRTCNPNGPIHVLIDKPEAFTACFKELPPNAGSFSVMQVTASTSGINFEHDGIKTIHLFIRYDQVDEKNPDRPKFTQSGDGVLKSDADALHLRLNLARDAQGGYKREYSFRTDVFYGNGEVISHPQSWNTCSDAMLLINPAAMGAVRVELVLTAPRDQVKSARVTLRFQKSDGETVAETIDLTPEASKQSWFKPTGVVSVGGVPQEYSYQAVYQLGGAQITMPWVNSSAESLELPGPFVKVLSFNLRPQGSFDGVANISGDVTYSDPSHQYQIVRSFALDKLGANFQLDVPVMDGGPEEISYTARINRSDGSWEQLDRGRGAAGTVWIGHSVAQFLSVQVLTDLIDFDKDVQLAVVHLSHTDTASNAVSETTFTFSKSARAAQTWRAPLGADSAKRYDADIRFIAYDRAKSSEVHQKGITDAVLLLDRQAS